MIDKNGTIRKADLALLSANPINTLTDKVAIFDNLEGIGLNHHANLQAAAIVLVRHGSIQVEVDLKDYTIGDGDIFFALPNQIACCKEFSQDLEFCGIAVSKETLEELMDRIDNFTRMILNVKNQPQIHMESDIFMQLFSSSFDLKRKFRTTQNNPYRLQILKNALISFLYECVGTALPTMDNIQKKSRKEVIFAAFMDMVMQNHKAERSVQSFAKELDITPKYLSAISEEISGKSAKQWIDEHIAVEAKILLKSSSKSILQVSQELNFPDISFFGKFFKRMTGVSPKNFRESEY